MLSADLSVLVDRQLFIDASHSRGRRPVDIFLLKEFPCTNHLHTIIHDTAVYKGVLSRAYTVHVVLIALVHCHLPSLFLLEIKSAHQVLQ